MDYKFTSPVDPTTNIVLRNGWVDATGYDGENQFGPHSGNDLNKNTPVWNSDAGAPIYAIGDGKVTCSKRFPTWGWVIVIDHSTPTLTLMSRYAHVLSTPDKVKVVEGQIVRRGDAIAYIGNADGTQADHLHVDLTPTDILRISPSYYPKTHEAVRMYFIDMIKFLLKQGQEEVPAMGLTIKKLKNVSGGAVKVRTFPEVDNVKAPQITQVVANGVVETRAELGRVTSGNYEWAYVIANDKGGWTAVKDIAANKEWFAPF